MAKSSEAQWVKCQCACANERKEDSGEKKHLLLTTLLFLNFNGAARNEKENKKEKKVFGTSEVFLFWVCCGCVVKCSRKTHGNFSFYCSDYHIASNWNNRFVESEITNHKFTKTKYSHNTWKIYKWNDFKHQLVWSWMFTQEKWTQKQCIEWLSAVPLTKIIQT